MVATQIFLEFSPLFGEDFQFDERIFQMGWFNHQLVLLGVNGSFRSALERKGEKKPCESDPTWDSPWAIPLDVLRGTQWINGMS